MSTDAPERIYIDEWEDATDPMGGALGYKDCFGSEKWKDPQDGVEYIRADHFQTRLNNHFGGLLDRIAELEAERDALRSIIKNQKIELAKTENRTQSNQPY